MIALPGVVYFLYYACEGEKFSPVDSNAGQARSIHTIHTTQGRVLFGVVQPLRSLCSILFGKASRNLDHNTLLGTTTARMLDLSR